jgi:hypothetical protein
MWNRLRVFARRIIMKSRAAVGGVLAASMSLGLLASCASDDSTPENPSGSGAPAALTEGSQWRWVGARDVEVLAPRAWGFDYEAVRPDCIDARNPVGDPWARDVPGAPYVMVGTPNRGVPAIGCLREREPGDPGPAFGDLPFSLWQPFVKVEQARPDLEGPGRTDGRWDYEGWRLTRQTVERVQVTVLAPPDHPSLGTEVLDSVRQVETNSLGCAATSPAQAVKFARPKGASIPPATRVGAIAICHYSRMDRSRGLEGSRRVTGPEARDLVEAIQKAPRSGGPDEPQHCVKDMYGDTAMTLRFFESLEQTERPLAEAYVYYDWCFGNGIFDSQGAHQLTRANCSPLFARPPISFWSGQVVITEVCGPLAS